MFSDSLNSITVVDYFLNENWNSNFNYHSDSRVPSMNVRNTSPLEFLALLSMPYVKFYQTLTNMYHKQNCYTMYVCISY